MYILELEGQIEIFDSFEEAYQELHSFFQRQQKPLYLLSITPPQEADPLFIKQLSEDEILSLYATLEADIPNFTVSVAVLWDKVAERSVPDLRTRLEQLIDEWDAAYIPFIQKHPEYAPEYDWEYWADGFESEYYYSTELGEMVPVNKKGSNTAKVQLPTIKIVEPVTLSLPINLMKGLQILTKQLGTEFYAELPVEQRGDIWYVLPKIHIPDMAVDYASVKTSEGIGSEVFAIHTHPGGMTGFSSEDERDINQKVVLSGLTTNSLLSDDRFVLTDLRLKGNQPEYWSVTWREDKLKILDIGMVTVSGVKPSYKEWVQCISKVFTDPDNFTTCSVLLSIKQQMSIATQSTLGYGLHKSNNAGYYGYTSYAGYYWNHWNNTGKKGGR